ncbi:ABC transporter substrate-binding protein [Planosporangium flavigriseum]|uniref:ABC transporter substrate-binding protein n=1 Tax=Planosporangium flavigriseum TaxID=373681 RepID=A0A8J3LR66_9ACTN|nr:ABC transporter substrate-binding protein [Planosporangium flavigriseum]NJC66175.1 ABC transporter substrate-binding protein [Planosporangium flavigriseum]GIG75133.1 ABC transporter substrate-binding protein [Planosporangium flavigriseum]
MDLPQVSRRTLLQGALGAGALSALAACGGGSSSGKSSGNKTLVYADSDTPPSFDTDTGGAVDTGESIVANCYAGDVFGFNKVSGPNGVQIADMLAKGVKGGIAMGFAESVDVSDDLRTYTVHLRSGVKSALGNTLTADDVVWSYQRSLALKQTGAFMTNAMGITDPSQITKLDASTVRFSLPSPSPIFLKVNAAKLYAGLFDSVAAKAHATADDPWARNWLSQNTAGFGPYTVKSMQKGRFVNLEANPNYFKGAPAYSKVVWNAVPTSANRMALLQGNDADIAVKLTPPQLKQAQAAKLKVTSYQANQIKSMQLNTKYGPLGDYRVRQAIAYAMPYEDILSSVYLGTATAVRSPLPSSYPGYTDEYWSYSTNMDKARALLRDAGVSGFKLTLSYETTNYDDPLIAPIVKAALGDLGITVELEGLPQATFSEKLYSRKGQAYLVTNWPFVADPGYALGVYWKSTAFNNVGAWSNAEFDKLVDQMLVEAADERRYALAKTAQEIYMREQPWILLANPGWHVAHSAGVSGLTWYPNNGVRFEDIKPA